MVEVTQGIEVRFGMSVHGFPWRNSTRPIERMGEAIPLEIEPVSMIGDSAFRRPEGPGKICRAKFHSVGN